MEASKIIPQTSENIQCCTARCMIEIEIAIVIVIVNVMHVPVAAVENGKQLMRRQFVEPR